MNRPVLFVSGSLAALLVSCGAARTSATTAAPATTTDRRIIRLDRPYTVGERVRIESAATERTQSTLALDGQPSGGQQREETAQMAARVEVLAVSARGEPTHSRFTIERFEFGSTGQASRAIPAGQVLDVTRGDTADHAVVTVNGTPATSELRHAVQLLVNLTTDDAGVSSDAVFGSSEARAPGETWPVDADRAAQSLAATSGVRGHYTGATHFIGLATVRGVPCLSLEMTLDGDLDGLPDLPGGVTLDHAHLRTRGRMMIPSDEHLPRVQSTVETHLEIDAHGVVQQHAATLHVVHEGTKSDITLMDSAAASS